jgi:hypothetical protein
MYIMMHEQLSGEERYSLLRMTDPPEAHGFPINPDRRLGENRAARRARLKRERREATTQKGGAT